MVNLNLLPHCQGANCQEYQEHLEAADACLFQVYELSQKSKKDPTGMLEGERSGIIRQLTCFNQNHELQDFLQ